MPFYQARGILLVHIPKTGGSWVDRMLTTANGKGVKPLFKTSWTDFCAGQHEARGFATSEQHLTLSDVLRRCGPALIPEVREVWFVTRHPTARLLSEYVYLKRHVLSRLEDDSAARFGGADFASIRFDTFRNFCFTAHFAAQRNPAVADGHFRPQCAYLRLQNGARIEQVFPSAVVRAFRFEAFPDVYRHVARVWRRAGLEWSPRQEQVAVTRLSTATKKREIINLDRATLALIHHWFRDDFSFFGYDPHQHTFPDYPTRFVDDDDVVVARTVTHKSEAPFIATRHSPTPCTGGPICGTHT